MAAESELIQVTVEIDAAAEPIGGSVRTGGCARPFSGWMQLTAALEDARIAGVPGGDPRVGDDADTDGESRS